jgi:hypothetical protein
VSIIIASIARLFVTILLVGIIDLVNLDAAVSNHHPSLAELPHDPFHELP